MFLVNCYVRKISQELMDKLNQLGYEDAWNGYIHTEELKTITFACTNRKGEALWSLTGFPPEEYIDCGDNERLFLALAALRDDTDRYQWFTDGKLFEMSSGDLPSKYMQLEGHKATVKELLEFFRED